MSKQDEDEDAELLARLEESAPGNPAMQRGLSMFKKMRGLQREAEAKWSVSFEAFFARHPPLPIPTWRDLSTPLEQAQFEVALKWAQQEFARLRWTGNTVLSGDRPSAAAMRQVLEALPQRPNGARLLLRADWKRFQEWHAREHPGNPAVYEPDGYSSWWHRFEPVDRTTFGTAEHDMIAASDIEHVASAPPHVRFFTQERGSWHGSLAAEWRETLWQFDGQKFEFVNDLSFSVS